MSLAILSLLFGFATTIVWYLVVKELFSKKAALYSTIILLLFPIFFIINTNITYEAELLFLQTVSFLILIKGLKYKKNVWIFVAGLFLGLAHLVFIGTLFITPIFVYFILLLVIPAKAGIQSMIFQFKKGNYCLDPLLRGDDGKKTTKHFTQSLIYSGFFCLGYVITGFIADYFLLGSLPLIAAKYTSHATDVVSGSQGVVLLIARVLRNIVYQAVAILSPGGAFLFGLAIMLILFVKKFSKLKYLLLAVIPYLILMQYWHAGLFGRLALGIVFPASLFIAYVFEDIKKQVGVLLLLFVFFALFILIQAQSPPLYQYYSLIKNEKNYAVITSDYNRFIYEEHAIPHFVIKGDTPISEIKKYIDTHIKNKVVLIDSAAVRYPYFQYDGNTYHILSVNKRGTPSVQEVLKKYSTTRYKEIRGSDIYFLKIGK
jgi:hypothetical protein